MMAEKETPKWIGVASLVLGALSAVMLFFEIKDGTLLGSKSDGITVNSSPIVYYVSVVLQTFVVVLLLLAGLSVVRRKNS